MATFDHVQRTRLVFGNGSVARAGELATELGLRRILLVTDPGLVRAGHVATVRASLEAAGLQVAVFDAVIENPTTDCVETCRRAAEASGVDSFLGLGGGSSMDTAKGANF
ncbi:MAG: iron-containing alcohol dehydrogenase, partial [Verrucomicrobiota bacterium]|nr:iron-containing alcohol dehydrogenase [Verrucomicrobiota bacterium]